MGGRIAAHLICDAEFQASHLCHVSEYLLSTSPLPVPPSGAWADGSVTPTGASIAGASPTFGRRLSLACSNWTTRVSTTNGPVLLANGGTSSQECSTQRPLACCTGVPKVQVAGFTTANAPMTGRVAMHAACAAQFSGSHFCHSSEYVRATSTLPVPAAGAWLDSSTTIDGGGTVDGSPMFGRSLGLACGNWTSTASGTTGNVVTTDGSLSGSASCATPRPIACCR
jgi:hypothetical protein